MAEDPGVIWFDQEQARLYEKYGVPEKNGHKCPNCGWDLLDTTPKVHFNTNPPKVNTGCPRCGFRGHRII